MEGLKELERKRENFRKYGSIYAPRLPDLKRIANKVVGTLSDWEQTTIADVILNGDMQTEGCDCCSDTDGHKEDKKKLAELFGSPNV